MDLYVVRHAEAAARGENGSDTDEARTLTDAGRAASRKIAQVLQDRGIHVEAVVASPLVRAQQTAEEMLAVWGPEAGTLHTCDALAPGGRPKKLARFLRELKADAVAIVGHQPDLGELTAWFVGGREAQIDLAKGGVAYVHFPDEPEKGEGMLVWLVTPEWFAAPTPIPATTA
jgi:phosphohistidine phosphatase